MSCKWHYSTLLRYFLNVTGNVVHLRGMTVFWFLRDNEILTFQSSRDLDTPSNEFRVWLYPRKNIQTLLCKSECLNPPALSLKKNMEI